MRAKEAAARVADARHALREAGEADASRTRLVEELGIARATFAAFDEDERAALLSHEVPLLLTPVRLETEFALDGSQVEGLRVRVYPDTVHLDGFDPRLTEHERELARTVAEGATARPADASALEAWMDDAIGPGRAAWARHAFASGTAATRPDGADGPPTLARLLPDSWLLVARWTGGRIVHPFPEPVAEPLTVGPSAQDDSEGQGPDALWARTPGTGAAGEGLGWMLDFKRALRAGMACELDLRHGDGRALAAHLEAGGTIETLTVLGVRASADAEASADELAALLTAHAVDRDARIAPQGSATSNDGHHRTPARATRRGGANVRRIVKALGAPGEAEALLGDVAVDERDLPGAMSAALWPGTVGAFTGQMLDMPAEATDGLWRVVVGELRARGPYSALRVGTEPYGILPVSLSEGDGDDAIGARIRTLLGKADAAVLDANPEADDARGPATFDDWLARFGREPHPGVLLSHTGASLASFSTSARASLPPEAKNVFAALDIDPEGVPAGDTHLLGGVATGVTPPVPLVRHASGTRQGQSTPRTEQDLPLDGRGLTLAALLKVPGRDRYPVRPHREMPAVRRVRLRRTRGVLEWSVRDTEETPDPVLFTLLRHALFEHFAELARWYVIEGGERPEPTYRHVETSGASEPSTVFPLFDQLGAAVGGEATEILRVPLDDEAIGALSGQPSDALLRQNEGLAKALGLLVATGRDDPAALELALREHLGLIGYRVDAWHTLLATRDIDKQREHRRDGIQLGAFGRVHALAPRFGAPDRPEFVPTLSSAHAVTAAILRAGHKSRRRADRGPASGSIDLSSERVAAALDALDGVRAGRPLSEVLGQRVERALRLALPEAAERKHALDVVRRAAPARAGWREPGTTGATADLTDGMALVDAHMEGKPPPSPLSTGSGGAPPLSADARGRIGGAIADAIKAATDVVDAISDLCLAEGVHQIANGGAERAGASLDAISRGDPPPDRFDVVRTPRGGVGLTLRALVLGAASPPPSAVASATREAFGRLRGAVGGPLAAIVGPLVGPVEDLGCWVYAVDRHGRPVDLRSGTGGIGTWVRLADLGLDATTLVLAVTPGAEPSYTLLDALLCRAVPATGAERRLDVAQPGPDGEPAFAATLELLGRINAMIGSARALGPADLVTPDRAPPESAADPEELATRAEHALAHALAGLNVLRAAAGPVPAGDDGPPVPTIRGTPLVASALDRADATPPADPAHLRTALEALAVLGVGGALPGQDEGGAELMVRARSAHGSLLGSIRAATEPTDAAPDGPDATARLHAILGRDYPVVPLLMPEQARDFASLLAAGPDLGVAHDTADVTAWAHDVARVRPRMARAVEAFEAAEGLNDVTHLDFALAQTPTGADSWSGLRLDDDPEPETDPPVVAFAVADVPPGVGAGEPFGGLLIDEWTETVPAPEHSAALAVEADLPTARAPQLMILGTTGGSGGWTMDRVMRLVDETERLARIRALGPEQMGALGFLLPAAAFVDHGERRERS